MRTKFSTKWTFAPFAKQNLTRKKQDAKIALEPIPQIR